MTEPRKSSNRAKYFVHLSDGQVQGPITSREVQQLASSGVLTREDGISNRAEGPWKRAGKIPNLIFDRSPVQSIQRTKGIPSPSASRPQPIAANSPPQPLQVADFKHVVQESMARIPFDAEVSEPRPEYHEVELKYLKLSAKLDSSAFWFRSSSKHKAWDRMLALAEDGCPQACFDIGASYDLGLHCEKDEALAAKWFTRAALAGNPSARQLVAHGLIAGHWPLEGLLQISASLVAMGIPVDLGDRKDCPNPRGLTTIDIGETLGERFSFTYRFLSEDDVTEAIKNQSAMPLKKQLVLQSIIKYRVGEIVTTKPFNSSDRDFLSKLLTSEITDQLAENLGVLGVPDSIIVGSADRIGECRENRPAYLLRKICGPSILHLGAIVLPGWAVAAFEDPAQYNRLVSSFGIITIVVSAEDYATMQVVDRNLRASARLSLHLEMEPAQVKHGSSVGIRYQDHTGLDVRIAGTIVLPSEKQNGLTMDCEVFYAEGQQRRLEWMKREARETALPTIRMGHFEVPKRFRDPESPGKPYVKALGYPYESVTLPMRSQALAAVGNKSDEMCDAGRLFWLTIAWQFKPAKPMKKSSTVLKKLQTISEIEFTKVEVADKRFKSGHRIESRRVSSNEKALLAAAVVLGAGDEPEKKTDWDLLLEDLRASSLGTKDLGSWAIHPEDVVRCESLARRWLERFWPSLEFSPLPKIDEFLEPARLAVRQRGMSLVRATEDLNTLERTVVVAEIIGPQPDGVTQLRCKHTDPAIGFAQLLQGLGALVGLIFFASWIVRACNSIGG